MKTRCPKCESTEGFECVIEEVKDYNYKLCIIRCKSCKVMISSKEYNNIGTLVNKLAEKLRVKVN